MHPFDDELEETIQSLMRVRDHGRSFDRVIRERDREIGSLKEWCISATDQILELKRQNAERLELIEGLAKQKEEIIKQGLQLRDEALAAKSAECEHQKKRVRSLIAALRKERASDSWAKIFLAEMATWPRCSGSVNYSGKA